MMTPLSLLMSLLLLLSFSSSGTSSPMCNNQCCRFVEGFPVRLRKLRQDYLQIRDYYEASDDLDTALLDQSVEDSFNSEFACYTLDSILSFYLRTILPKALADVREETRDLKTAMESIQQIFNELKNVVTKCELKLFLLAIFFHFCCRHGVYGVYSPQRFPSATAAALVQFNVSVCITGCLSLSKSYFTFIHSCFRIMCALIAKKNTMFDQ